MQASSSAKKILKSYPQDVQQYFAEIDEKLRKQGYTFKLSGGQSLNNGGRCGGYFDDKTKILAIALGRGLERSLSLLCHELGHFQQKMQKSSIWHNYRIYNGHSRFFYYLGGKKIYKPTQASLAAIKLEADCERRSFKLVKKWQKYVNLDRYCAEANSYVLSYHWMLENKRWMKGSPYDRKIIAHSPTQLMRSYKKIPMRLKMAFDRYL